MISLKDKVIYVTGASRGIGEAVAVLCAELGAEVILHASAESSLEAVKAEIEGITGTTPLCFAYECSEPAHIKEAFGAIKKHYGRLDAAVLNAGVMMTGMLGMIQEQHMERVLRVNLFSTIEHLQYAARVMRSANTGSIVCLGSIIGERGAAGATVYSASKAGVRGAALSAAKELAGSGIRVNVVAPGYIDTDLNAQHTPQQKAQYLERIPFGRMGEAKEVAALIAFLVSDASSYITAQVIGVDGGMTT